LRLAIVNNASATVEMLQQIIQKALRHKIIWTACNGAEAIIKCSEDSPDLILMDLEMAPMNGIEAIHHIMKNSPCSILVVTAVTDDNSSKVFDALGAGALDAVNIPTLGPQSELEDFKELLRKISILEKLIITTEQQKDKNFQKMEQEPPFLVAIGSSTGGPTALVDFFSKIPANIKAAFVVAQHVDKQFAPGLVSWLDTSCDLKVELAVEGASPESGKVFIAATNDHLIVSKNMRLSYCTEPKNNPYRPSVDVFFNSIAANWKDKGAAVLLTGIGRDGAEGLLTLKKLGWPTFAQDKESSVVYGMPKAAVELGAAGEVLSPTKISEKIMQLITVNSG
jgi:two-component system response regulator WspF